MSTSILARLQVALGFDSSEFDSKLAKTTKQLESTGKKMEKVGQSLSIGLTAPLAGFGAFAIKASGDFEAAMNRVQAATQAPARELDLLQQKAKELGLNTKFSAQEAAIAMEVLAKNGLDTAQILGGAVDASTALAAATGGDLATSADIATDVMLNFNKAASELQGLVNGITGATLESKFGIEDYRLALGQAGGVAGQLGVSFEDFNTAIAATSSAFTSGSDAGTSFKTFVQRLAPQTDKAAKAMQKLGLNFFDAQGKMLPMRDVAEQLQDAFADLSDEQRTLYGTEIFGSDAIRTGLLLAKQGAEGFDQLAESISKVSAAGQADTLMKGWSGAILEFKAALEGFQIALGESGLLDFGTSIVKGVTEALRSLSQLSPGILRVGMVFAGLAAAIGPALVAIGFLSSTVIPALVAGLTAVVSPVVLVAGAIAGVTVAIAAIAASAGAFTSLKEETDSANKSFDSQKAKVTDLYQNFMPLLQRHDELKTKSKLSTEEQEELKNAVAEIAKVVPGAVTQFDEYGRAIGVSTDAAYKFLEAQRLLMETRNKDRIAAETKELESYQRQLEEIRKIIAGGVISKGAVGPQGIPKIDTLTPEDMVRLGEKATELERKIKGLKLSIADYSGQSLVQEDTKKVEDRNKALDKQAEIIGLLARQQELLKDAQERKTSATTEEDITLANRQIKVIEKEIARLEDLGSVIARISNMGRITLTPELELNLPELKDDQIGAEALKEAQKSFQRAAAEGMAYGDVFAHIKTKIDITRSAISSLLTQGFQLDSTPVQDLISVLGQLQTKSEEIRIQKFEVQVISNVQQELEKAAAKAELFGDTFKSQESKIEGVQTKISNLLAKGYQMDSEPVKQLQIELDKLQEQAKEIQASKIDVALSATGGEESQASLQAVNLKIAEVKGKIVDLRAQDFDFNTQGIRELVAELAILQAQANSIEVQQLGADVSVNIPDVSAQAKAYGEEAAKKYGEGFFKVADEIEKVQEAIAGLRLQGFEEGGDEITSYQVKLQELRTAANEAIVQRVGFEVEENPLASLDQYIGTTVASVTANISTIQGALDKLTLGDPETWNVELISQYQDKLIQLETQLSGLKDAEFEVNIQSNVAEELARIAETEAVLGESFDEVAAKAGVLNSAISSMIDNGFGRGNAVIQGFAEQLALLPAEMENLKAAAEQLSEDMSKAFEGMFENVLVAIGEGIGNLIAGGGGMDQMFNTILEVVGKFISQMGEMLIAYGVGMEAFKQAFSNPYTAIIAGMALVALGTAISSFARSAPTGSAGGGGGAAIGGGGSASPGRQLGSQAPQLIQVEGRISGHDLRLVQVNYDNKARRTGG